jgi:protein O-mannosyl-transferase
MGKMIHGYYRCNKVFESLRKSNSSKQFEAAVALSRPVWLGGLFIILATLAAYWPVFSAGFIPDDPAYVTENPLLTAPDGLARIWFSAQSQPQYVPLVFTTLRIEYAFWGLNPVGYHVVNVCLHVLNALLVWALLRRLAVPRAWLAAAVFALHPVQVETVAWVTELKNTESTLFYLLAVSAWLDFCAGKSRWFYALAILLHLLALFAKTTACTLPAVLLLVLWLKHEPVTWRRVVQTLPFWLLGLGMGLLSVWWEKHLGNYAPKFHLLGGPLERLLLAAHALWFYAHKILWPANLAFSYPRWQMDAGDWRQYTWLAGWLAVAALLWFGRRKFGRGPAAALIFFAAVLSPMLGFIPLYTFYFSYVADHYQYLACLGLIVLGLGLAAKFFETCKADHRLRVALAALLLLMLGAHTWQQAHIYHDRDTLWTDTLKKNPRSWMAHKNLASLRAEQERFDEAEDHYRLAIELNPAEDGLRYDFGNLLARLGRFDDATAQYRQALLIAPGNAAIHCNLGYALNKQHRTDEAIAEYQRAIACQPDFAEAYYNLGNALSTQHKMDEAIAAYQRAVQLKPDSELFKKRLQALGVPAN